MSFNIYERDPAKRVALGKVREAQIADALRDQHHLDIRNATETQDKFRKIDRWIFQNGKRIPLQIKFRTKGDDLLFEVYDTFRGWEYPDGITLTRWENGKTILQNKIGRDMQGDAQLYAVLLSDGKTIKVVDTSIAKAYIWSMVQHAEENGWTREGYTKTLIVDAVPARTKNKEMPNYRPAELKLQHDPGDGRPKMVAYVPPLMFDGPVYTVSLPERWAA